MTQQKIVRSYLLLSALVTLARSFTVATYVLYLRQHNLNYFETNLMNVAFFTAMFLFELPTGAFADVFGRRAAFITSCLCWSGSAFIYGSSATPLGFMIAEIGGALGATMASGAFQAWFVDRLHHHGYEGSILPFLFKERLYNTTATIIAAITGAFIAARYGREMSWFTEGAFLLLTTLVAVLFMREEYFSPKRESLRTRAVAMITAAKDGLSYGRSHPKIRFLFAIGLAFSFAVQAPNMQWQPFFQDAGLGQVGLGIAMAATQLALLIGAWFGLRVARQVHDEQRLLRTTLGLAGLGIAITVVMPGLGSALSVFLAHELFRGAYQPVKDAYLNQQIAAGDPRRATILSFESLSRHTGGIVGLLASGLIAEYVSPAAAWLSSGGLLIGAVLWVGKNGKR